MKDAIIVTLSAVLMKSSILRPSYSSGGVYHNQQQEISLGLTLVAISVLFILCQSVKILPDLHELGCEVDEKTKHCHTSDTMNTLIR